MKLKLEPNFLTKYSKEGVLDEDVNYAKVSFLHSLLTPHLKMVPSIQVPKEKRMNSKGFFNRKQVNHTIGKHCLSLLDLTEKSLDLSGKKKASLIRAYSLFSQESIFIFFAFRNSVNRGSSLSSSILIAPN
jgi:hypothetical protein